MDKISVVIILLAIVTALAQVSDKVKVPYPIMLVLAGVCVGLFPNLPKIYLDPDVVFLIFLPPVLYAAAWNTSLPDFVASARAISLLAIGCVLFTTTVVAIAAHYFIPNFGWAESFVLGAIISPPDAVAAGAATKGLGIPRRVITILEGESLVNDATGLIAYRYAISAAATGTFIFWLAGANFFYVAGMGIGLGLAVGVVFLFIHKITPDNALADTTLTFLTPYTAYLVAERFHASGVLAVVVAGLFLSQRSSSIFNHQSRLQANFVWQAVIFMLNGVIFVLIGLELHEIRSGMEAFPVGTLIGYGALISITTIVVRIIWVFPATYLPRWLSPRVRRREPRPDKRLVGVVAWSGMRGVVSLAAALALPLAVNGNPFPNRDVIIFISFCVIFATLVVQGLTLPVLIKWLGIKASDKELHEEDEARVKVASAMVEHIEETYSLALTEQALNEVKTRYEIRIQRIRKDQTSRKISNEQINELHTLRQELISTERTILQRMRRAGEISDEVLRKIEYELDLEEEQLLLEKVGA